MLGGAERVLISLLEGGASRGWDQVVLNPFAADPERAELARVTAAATYRGHACSHVLQLPGTRHWLAAELAANAPDVVHVHLFHALMLSAMLRRGSRAPWILTHHHTGALDAAGRRSEALLDRLAGRRFDRVVAVSEWSRQMLLGRYGYPATKVACIPNGWDGDPLPRRPGAHPTVICVANFRKQKAHGTLIAAFGLVAKELPDARLVLIGDGELRTALTAQVETLRLGDQVRFSGAVDDVWPWLAEADVFALASEYEPLGIAVMEAMAAGLPVVATTVGGLTELVNPGITGALVAPHDHQALAAELMRLLRNPPLGAEMGAQGKAAASEWRMSECVARYFELYEQSLDRPTRGAA